MELWDNIGRNFKRVLGKAKYHIIYFLYTSMI